MTLDEFTSLYDSTVAELRGILVAKGNDYTGGQGADRLANFKVISHLGIASAEQGLLCRLVDKISRINTFLKSGKLSVNESAIDAIHDIIGYSILLKALLSERNSDVD